MIRRFAARAGDVLFHPGAACPGFLILDEGTIRVTLTAANGREVVLYRVTRGSICLQTFTCLVSDARYSAEGVVEADVTGEIVPAELFQARLAEDDGFRALVFDGVAERFSEYQRLVEEVALTGFDQRLARVLLRLADAASFVTATHAALAVETASGRAFVSRRLAEFARQGVVEQAKGGVQITDRVGLERIAADSR